MVAANVRTGDVPRVEIGGRGDDVGGGNRDHPVAAVGVVRVDWATAVGARRSRLVSIRRGRRVPAGHSVRVHLRGHLRRGHERGWEGERRVGRNVVRGGPPLKRRLVFSRGSSGGGGGGGSRDVDRPRRGRDGRRRARGLLSLRRHGSRGVLEEAPAVSERRRVVDVRGGGSAVYRARGGRLVVVTDRPWGVVRRRRDERREAESGARVHRAVREARSRAAGPSVVHVRPRHRNVLGGDVKVAHLVVSVRVHAGLVFMERG